MENLKDFMTHRRQELEKYDREQERQRRERDRESWSKNKATAEEIAKIKEKYSNEINQLADMATNM